MTIQSQPVGQGQSVKNQSEFKNVTDGQINRHSKVFSRVSATKNLGPPQGPPCM